MSDGGGGAHGFVPALIVGPDAQAPFEEGHVCELSPQEARDPLQNLLQGALVEVSPNDDGAPLTVDPRNPGTARLVREEDGDSAPPQIGVAP